jgi:hypothetical protein
LDKPKYIPAKFMQSQNIPSPAINNDTRCPILDDLSWLCIISIGV